MKHIEVVELSRPEEPKEQTFDLVLEELEERHEFGLITPKALDPGGRCANCCFVRPPWQIGCTT